MIQQFHSYFPMYPKVCKYVRKCMLSRSVVSGSLQPHGLQPASLPCPWDFPGKNTGVGCHSLFRGPRDWLNLGLLNYNSGGFFTVWATREPLIHILSPAKHARTRLFHDEIHSSVDWFQKDSKAKKHHRNRSCNQCVPLYRASQ